MFQCTTTTTTTTTAFYVVIYQKSQKRKERKRVWCWGDWEQSDLFWEYWWMGQKGKEQKVITVKTSTWRENSRKGAFWFSTGLSLSLIFFFPVANIIIHFWPPPLFHKYFMTTKYSSHEWIIQLLLYIYIYIFLYVVEYEFSINSFSLDTCIQVIFQEHNIHMKEFLFCIFNLFVTLFL